MLSQAKRSLNVTKFTQAYEKLELLWLSTVLSKLKNTNTYLSMKLCFIMYKLNKILILNMLLKNTADYKLRMITI